MNLFIHPAFSHEPLLRTSYQKPVRNKTQSSFQELLGETDTCGQTQLYTQPSLLPLLSNDLHFVFRGLCMPQGGVHLKSLFMPYMTAFMSAAEGHWDVWEPEEGEFTNANFLENLHSHRCKHWNPCLQILCLHAVRPKSLNREWHPTCPLSSWS